jgi:hypothetical protein
MDNGYPQKQDFLDPCFHMTKELPITHELEILCYIPTQHQRRAQPQRLATCVGSRTTADRWTQGSIDCVHDQPRVLTARCIVPLVHTTTVYDASAAGSRTAAGCRHAVVRFATSPSRPTELGFVQGSMAGRRMLLNDAHLAPKILHSSRWLHPVSTLRQNQTEITALSWPKPFDVHCIRNTSLRPDPANGLSCHNTTAQTPHLAKPNFVCTQPCR